MITISSTREIEDGREDIIVSDADGTALIVIKQEAYRSHFSYDEMKKPDLMGKFLMTYGALIVGASNGRENEKVL